MARDAIVLAIAKGVLALLLTLLPLLLPLLRALGIASVRMPVALLVALEFGLILGARRIEARWRHGEAAFRTERCGEVGRPRGAYLVGGPVSRMLVGVSTLALRLGIRPSVPWIRVLSPGCTSIKMELW